VRGEPVNRLATIAGIAVFALVVRGFRSRGLETSGWGYPALLATFPVYYWVFALYAADLAALPPEILAGIPFLAIAWIASTARSRWAWWLLAAAYVAHAAYDFCHDLLVTNAGVPAWWPFFCGSVDVLIGAYIALMAFRPINPPSGPRR